MNLHRMNNLIHHKDAFTDIASLKKYSLFFNNDLTQYWFDSVNRYLKKKIKNTVD